MEKEFERLEEASGIAQNNAQKSTELKIDFGLRNSLPSTTDRLLISVDAEKNQEYSNE